MMNRRKLSGGAPVVSLILGAAALVGAVEFYLGTPHGVFTDQALTPGATRVDTVVVSSGARSSGRPAQLVWAFACSTAAASDDSMGYATIRAITQGRTMHVGDDSLVLQPEPLAEAGWAGETQIMHTVADSYEVRTRNPMTGSAKGELWWYSRNER